MLVLRISVNIVLLCLLEPAFLMAQEKAGNEGGLMNITSYGSFKSWMGAMEPLGKNTRIDQFNNALNADSADIGVFWWDARDVQSVEVLHQSALQRLPVVQYWQNSWPETPPKMPSKEDLEDDPWQGKWITAKTSSQRYGNKLVFHFQPMDSAENANANQLPGEVTYRRTLKLRLVYEGKHPALESLAVYSASKEKNSAIRIELLPGNQKTSGVETRLEAFNGTVRSIAPWHWNGSDKKTGNTSFKLNIESKPKGILANITRSAGLLPGSNDETIVTFRSATGVFSFSMADVDSGPVYIPYYHVYITKADDTASFTEKNILTGKKIRERIPEEPEQTYERAKKEIPALDPTNRSGGGYIDLPLAADASWQKFAIQWGGNVIIDKVQSKAQGREKLRCNWKGDAIKWDLGTGKVPEYHRTNENCQMSMMNNYLPVVEASWHQGGLNYQQESFATLLRGPLSPNDPNRDEQVPALLMMKLTISNPGNKADTSVLWMKGNDAINQLSFEGDFLMDEISGKKFIRAYLSSSDKTLFKDSTGTARTVQRKVVMGPNSSQVFYYYFPFVGDLGESEQQEIAAMDFNVQKQKVVAYWRELVEKTSVFNVPERKFNEMGKAVIPHIRISVTKDPKSGLYMVPAAALSYKVYPNESIFQTLLLDRLGDFKTSADYLNSFMALQGSSKLPGTFTGDQKDVFYGLRVDSMYDMTERNGYNMHHGTVLWGLARHYLYSHDNEWLKKAAPHMIRAAKWIIEQRANTRELDEKGNKETHYGLLPAGVLEDVHDWQHWYATNAYAYLGMQSMAEAFRIAGMPEAAYYEKAAGEYYDDIRASMQTASELSPVIRLRNNTFVPYVPSRPHQRFRYFGTKKADYYNRYNKHVYPNLRLSAIREALYGPIVLLKAGLIDVSEPMADWVLDDWEDNLTISSSLNLNVHGRVEDEYWFSRGGMVFQANLQNPVGIYLLRQEIPATIRGLYDNFISCLYPDVNAHTEEYHEWGKGSGPFYKCPDEARFISQVCDLLVVEKKNELWLAAGIPRRWLEAGERIELNKAFTEYGEVSFTMKQGELPETIEAMIQMPERKSSKVLLFVRAPFQKPIKRVVINGKESTDWDAAKESVVIPQFDKNVKVVISY